MNTQKVPTVDTSRRVGGPSLWTVAARFSGGFGDGPSFRTSLPAELRSTSNRLTFRSFQYLHFRWELRLCSLFCGTFLCAKWTRNNDLTVGHATDSRLCHACSALKILLLKVATDLPAAFKNPFCARKMRMSN